MELLDCWIVGLLDERAELVTSLENTNIHKFCKYLPRRGKMLVAPGFNPGYGFHRIIRDKNFSAWSRNTFEQHIIRLIRSIWCHIHFL